MDEAKKHNLTFREFTPEGGETIIHVQERVQNFYNVSLYKGDLKTT